MAHAFVLACTLFVQVGAQEAHIFYHLDYRSPAMEGEDWMRWNARTRPHWDHNVNHKHYQSKNVRADPPVHIHSAHYPLRGLYSCTDTRVLTRQMKEISSAGITGLIIVYDPLHVLSMFKKRTKERSRFVKRIADTAARFNMKVSFALQKYKQRTPLSVREDIRDLVSWCQQSWQRFPGPVSKPIIYIYDAHHHPAAEWAKVLKLDGVPKDPSIRGTRDDAVVLGHYVAHDDRQYLLDGGFDGFYTYFASDGVTEGADTREWKQMSDWAHQHGLHFVPTIGPGYDDTKLRPWNRKALQQRDKGAYYSGMFDKAVGSAPLLVTIASYNDWDHGTQIEPAADMHNLPRGINLPYKQYLAYPDYNPHFYLDLTKKLVSKMQQKGRDEL